MRHKIKYISEILFDWLAKIAQDDYVYVPAGLQAWDAKDWQVSKTIIFMHGMGPLWGYHSTKGWSCDVMPSEITDYLENQFYENTKRIKLIHSAYEEIGDKLTEASINFIPFKGIVLAEHLYPHIGCRPMADIDIYTGENSAARVCNIMDVLGYVAPATALSGSTYYPQAYIEKCMASTDIKNWIEATKNETRFDGESALMPFSIDVHFSMNIQSHWCQADLTEIFEATLISQGNRLSSDMMVVYYLLHAAKHIMPHNGRWIQLHDLFLILQESGFDPEAIAKIGHDLGASHLLLLPLVLCRKMFHLEKTKLEKLIEKNVSWRFMRLIDKVEISTHSNCNPSDSLFSLLPWALNIQTFSKALKKSHKVRSEALYKPDTSVEKPPPFIARLILRVKNIIISHPSSNWRLLAAQGLNPRKDWK